MNKQRTRDRIVAATWDLLATRPWAEVTVADICLGADVAARTFHRYFPEKAELLFVDTERYEDGLRAACAEHDLDQTRPVAWFSAVLHEMATAASAYGWDKVRQRADVIAGSTVLAEREQAKRAVMQGIVLTHLLTVLGPRDGLRATVWAGVGTGCFFAAFDRWLQVGGDLHESVDAALSAGADLFRP